MRVKTRKQYRKRVGGRYQHKKTPRIGSLSSPINPALADVPREAEEEPFVQVQGVIQQMDERNLHEILAMIDAEIARRMQMQP